MKIDMYSDIFLRKCDSNKVNNLIEVRPKFMLRITLIDQIQSKAKT